MLQLYNKKQLFIRVSRRGERIARETNGKRIITLTEDDTKRGTRKKAKTLLG